jgi:hypothetical protein
MKSPGALGYVIGHNDEYTRQLKVERGSMSFLVLLLVTSTAASHLYYGSPPCREEEVLMDNSKAGWQGTGMSWEPGVVCAPKVS